MAPSKRKAAASSSTSESRTWVGYRNTYAHVTELIRGMTLRPIVVNGMYAAISGSSRPTALALPGRLPFYCGDRASRMGAASVADLDQDGTGIVARPQAVEDPEVVSQVRLTINALQAEALLRRLRWALIMKVAEQRCAWPAPAWRTST